MISPLGKYSELVTSLITAFLVVTATLTHAFVPQADFSFIDGAALLAIGALYGRNSASNGYAAMAVAAHKRLDAIAAPPAKDGG